MPAGFTNGVMTGNQSWPDIGLGRTGEAYLAGSDQTMRSVSRLLLENPDKFVERVTGAGTPRGVAELQVQVGGSELLQPTHTEAVRRALDGEAGTMISTDYTGAETLMAYAPLDFDDLEWTIVAKIETDEAFAPVSGFAKTLALSTAALILVVSVLSLLFARVFTRPLNQLATAVRGVTARGLGEEIPDRRRAPGRVGGVRALRDADVHRCRVGDHRGRRRACVEADGRGRRCLSGSGARGSGRWWRSQSACRC